LDWREGAVPFHGESYRSVFVVASLDRPTPLAHPTPPA